MTTPIQLPIQHAIAPTPRADRFYNSTIAKLPHEWTDFARQLEREQQYMMEVMELLRNAHDHQHGAPCKRCEANRAYNNLKEYMEQKK